MVEEGETPVDMGSEGETPVDMGSGSGSSGMPSGYGSENESPVNMGSASGSGSEDPVDMGSGSGSGQALIKKCPVKTLMDNCNIDCVGSITVPTPSTLPDQFSSSKIGPNNFITTWTILPGGASGNTYKLQCPNASPALDATSVCQDGEWTVPPGILAVCGSGSGSASGSGSDSNMGGVDHGGMADHGSSGSGSDSSMGDMGDHGSSDGGMGGMGDHGK